jgi:hypothetical protein
MTCLSIYLPRGEVRTVPACYSVTNTVKSQYSKTNVMYFLFNLLRINGLYMFRVLLAHSQEALNRRHLVYCVRIMSVGCTRIGVELVSETRTQYTKCQQNIKFDSGKYMLVDERVLCDISVPNMQLHQPNTVIPTWGTRSPRGTNQDI